MHVAELRESYKCGISISNKYMDLEQPLYSYVVGVVSKILQHIYQTTHLLSCPVHFMSHEFFKLAYIYCIASLQGCNSEMLSVMRGCIVGEYSSC